MDTHTSLFKLENNSLYVSIWLFGSLPFLIAKIPLKESTISLKMSYMMKCVFPELHYLLPCVHLNN